MNVDDGARLGYQSLSQFEIPNCYRHRAAESALEVEGREPKHVSPPARKRWLDIA